MLDLQLPVCSCSVSCKRLKVPLPFRLFALGPHAFIKTLHQKSQTRKEERQIEGRETGKRGDRVTHGHESRPSDFTGKHIHVRSFYYIA